MPEMLLPLEANQPVTLDDTAIAWQVSSGTLALFAVVPDETGAPGPRRFLCTVGPGTRLCGLSDPRLAILAVPLGPAEVSRHDLSWIEPDSHASEALMAWGRVWGEVLRRGGARPPALVDAQPQHRVTLEGTQGLRAAEPLWIRVMAGELRWMGVAGAKVMPESGYVPLASGTWLVAAAPSEAMALPLAALPPGDAAQAAVTFGGLLVETLLAHVARVEKAEAEQFEARRAHDREVAEQAAERLASVLVDMPPPSPRGEPLYLAALEVANFQHITLREPPAWMRTTRLKHPLDAIARASNVRKRQVRLSEAWWTKDVGPLVAFTRDDRRPVALIPLSPGRYELYDPTDQSRRPVDAALAATLAPMATMFYRSLRATASGAKDLLALAFEATRGELPLMLAMGFAVALLGLVTPQATAILADHAIPAGDRGMLMQVGGALFAMAVATALFELVQSFAILRMETHVEAVTEAALWDRLLKLRPAFFRRFSAGDLSMRLSAVDTIRRMLTSSMVQTFLGGVFSLVSLVQLFFFSVPMALLALAFGVVTIAASAYAGQRIVTITRQMLEFGGNIVGLVVGLIGGAAKIQVAGAEQRAFNEWSKIYSQFQKRGFASQRVQDRLTVFNTALPLVATMAFFAGFAVPGSTPGLYMAFSVAFGTYLVGMVGIGGTVSALINATLLWGRAKPILAERPEVEGVKVDPGLLRGGLMLKHLNFRYGPGLPYVLRDVSLEAKPSEFIAIVGPSGSGKSTLIRLMLGFEQAEAGGIFFDGKDLSGLDIYAVRRQMGVVLQHGRILMASLFDNIANGALISHDDAWEAIRAAGMAEDVSRMPMGLHTMISEGGTNLSGGQRQRLLIARAIALKPRIILFDEATSALDGRTQAIVTASLERMQITRIIIAHRLSTIRNADRIYVIDAGRVVQVGTFETLLQEPGLFAQLMQRQMVEGG